MVVSICRNSIILAALSITLSCSLKSSIESSSNAVSESANTFNISTSNSAPMDGYMTPCEEIDEEDPTEPFSTRSLKANLKEADMVARAEVLTMKPDNLDTGYRGYTYTARVLEKFKGSVKPGEIVEYRCTLEVYDKEPEQADFLGERVLWLAKIKNENDQRFGRIEFVGGDIDCNILEKLRKLTKTK